MDNRGPALTDAHRQQIPRKKKHGLKIASIVASIIALALAVYVVIWAQQRDSVSSQIDKSSYQAVFFTNGQVYFGKLSRLNEGYLKLNDIYYLQAQDDEESSNPQKTTDDESSDVQLIKLGSEIHGPKDEMIMSENQVLFFENLKSDGRVATSIAEYVSSQED